MKNATCHVFVEAIKLSVIESTLDLCTLRALSMEKKPDTSPRKIAHQSGDFNEPRPLHLPIQGTSLNLKPCRALGGSWPFCAPPVFHDRKWPSFSLHDLP